MVTPQRFVGVVILFGMAVVDAQAPNPPSLILHNARIYTADARHSVAEAVAIAGDRIVRVGTEAEILGLKGPSTRLIDSGGGTVIPGLHDAHAHVVGLGASLQDVDLRGTRSLEEVVGRVRRRVASAEAGRVDRRSRLGSERLGRDGLANARPAERCHAGQSGLPRPAWTATPDSPTGRRWKWRISVRRSADPSGGRIIRSADGQPTGVVIDGAQALVTSAHPTDRTRAARGSDSARRSRASASGHHHRARRWRGR